jgi:hypothetical protein
MKVNKDKLKPVIVAAEKGDHESIALVARVLRPEREDSVDDIYDKIRIFIRLMFYGSLKFDDSDDHKKIDRAYAEQVHSYLNNGRPRYHGMIIVGYRESAKTTRVKFNETYLTLYLKDLVDYTNVVSEDGSSSDQFNMDMFNTFAFSKVAKYYPGTISSATSQKKKESQTMSKFSTTTGVTYSASSARKSKRGAVQLDIDETGEIENKRPKKTIFDDIENENTIRSIPATLSIESVMSSTIDGMDQVSGFWVLLGNYLSLRGNVARMLRKYKDDPGVFILDIPIIDGLGNPTWPGKYCRSDKEERELSEQGIIRKSIESIQRNSDNFETEYLNNPKRSSVYFDDHVLGYIDEESLHGETMRDENGLLIIEEAQPNEVYVIAADGAKGVGKDESSATVWKTSGLRFEEVANFKSKHVKPEDFSKVLANLGQRFNSALIIPENNYPGNEIIAFLRPVYHNIYRIEKKADPETGQPVHEYGVNTNLKTKPEMFLHSKRLFLDKLVTVRSRALYNQLLEYPNDDVLVIVQKDGSGGHFDLLMSAVIGLWKAGHISIDRTNQVSDARISKVVDSVFADEQESVR